MPDFDQLNQSTLKTTATGGSSGLDDVCVDDLLGNSFLSELTLGSPEVCQAPEEAPLWDLTQRLEGNGPLWCGPEEPLFSGPETPQVSTPVASTPEAKTASALPHYDVVPDDFVGPLQENQIRQTEADRRVALTPPNAEEKASKDPDYAARLRIAQEIIKIGGSGDLTDGRVVVEQLVDMPIDALRALQAKGTRVVACRDSVTDYLTDLKGVQPRGWPPGSTWDSVPGLNNTANNEVVIATRGQGTPEGTHVPRTGDGHGSYNLVIHETMHGVDLNNLPAGAHAQSEDPTFIAARNADSNIQNNSYLAQAGEAGRQETYAEIAARYYGGDPTLQAEMPHLYAYFASNPLAAKSAATNNAPVTTPAKAP